MNVILFKWTNVLNHIGNDKNMLKAFVKFYSRVQISNWKTPSDVIKTFNSADIILCKKSKKNRIVFNIGGNKYRMVCAYKFGNMSLVLYIKFVGTHSEYDRIEICQVNMFSK